MPEGFVLRSLVTITTLGVAGAMLGALVALLTGWVAAIGVGIAIGGAVAAVVIVLREEGVGAGR